MFAAVTGSGIVGAARLDPNVFANLDISLSCRSMIPLAHTFEQMRQQLQASRHEARPQRLPQEVQPGLSPPVREAVSRASEYIARSFFGHA